MSGESHESQIRSLRFGVPVPCKPITQHPTVPTIGAEIIANTVLGVTYYSL